jgi:hypothetical protein
MEETLEKVYSDVFKWLFIGLMITFGVAYLTANNITILKFLFLDGMYWLVFVAEILLGIFLLMGLTKYSKNLAIGLFLGYSALTGLSLSTIFIMYKIESVIYMILATAIAVGTISVLAKNSKINTKGFGKYLFIGLLALIALEFINYFFMNNSLNMPLNIAGIIIFIVYIVYDMRKVEELYETLENKDNIAIYGAFQIYLDFINILIRLLELFGKRND